MSIQSLNKHQGNTCSASDPMIGTGIQKNETWPCGQTHAIPVVRNAEYRSEVEAHRLHRGRGDFPEGGSAGWSLRGQCEYLVRGPVCAEQTRLK